MSISIVRLARPDEMFVHPVDVVHLTPLNKRQRHKLACLRGELGKVPRKVWVGTRVEKGKRAFTWEEVDCLDIGIGDGLCVGWCADVSGQMVSRSFDPRGGVKIKNALP